MARICLILFAVITGAFCMAQPDRILLPVVVKGKWGYIDTSGQMVIRPKYSAADDFYGNNIAMVKLDNKYGAVNNLGAEVLQPVFDKVSVERSYLGSLNYNTLVFYLLNGKWGCVDTLGKQLLRNEWDYYNVLGDDIVLLKKDTLDTLFIPFLVSAGKVLDQYQAVTARKLSTHYVLGLTDGNESLISRIGNEVIPPVYDSILYIENALVFFKDSGLVGIADTTGKILVKACLDWVSKFKGHLALVTKGFYYGLVNDAGKIILEPVYDRIKYSGNTVKARQNDKLWILELNDAGLISSSDVYENVKTITIENEFPWKNSSSLFNNSLASGASLDSKNSGYVASGWFYAADLKKWGLKNKSGDTLIKPMLDSVYSGKTNNYSVVEIKRKGKCSLANLSFITKYKYGIVNHSNGKWVLPPVYFNISLADFYDSTSNIIRSINEAGNWGYMRKDSITKFNKSSMIFHDTSSVLRVCYGSTVMVRINKNRSTGWLQDVITGPGLYFTFNRNPESVIFSDYFNHYDTPRSYYYAPYFLYLYSKNCKWGFLKKNGTLYPVGLQYATAFANDRSIVKKSDKWGVINTSMYAVIPIKYDSVAPLSYSNNKLYKLYVKNSKVGLLNGEGKFLTEMNYDKIGEAQNGFIIAAKDNLYGYLNKEGKEITAFRYKKANAFSEGFAAVKEGNRWSYINTSGITVITAQYTRADEFSEGLAFVTLKGSTGYIDTTGNMVFEIKCLAGGKFHSGVAWVKIRGMFGLMDKSRKWIIKPRFNKVEPYNNAEITIVRKGKRYGLVSNTGEIIAPFKYSFIQSHKNDLSLCRRNGRYGYLDEKGNESIEAVYADAGDFNEGYALVMKLNKYTVIDKSGTPARGLRKIIYAGDAGFAVADSNAHQPDALIQIPVKEMLKHYINNDSILYNPETNTYYYLKKSKLYKYYLDTIPDYVSREGGITIRQTGSKYGLVDKNGNPLTMQVFDDITPLNEGLGSYRQNMVYGVADASGNIIFPAKFEDVAYYGNNIYRVVNKNRLCYLWADGRWIWDPDE